MGQDEKISFTHSTVLSKKGEPYVAVRFERGKDFAEGSVPECRITESVGFRKEEITRLEEYLRENCKDILIKAKNISGIFKILG